VYIRAIEEQNKKLKEIAWMQSHVVRAPLARIMALINCLRKRRKGEMKTPEVLNHIMGSATELDNIIREIVNKSEQVTIKN
jgi:light-regulated signal transduction histidine kinase (bacteriophytochrome)